MAIENTYEKIDTMLAYNTISNQSVIMYKVYPPPPAQHLTKGRTYSDLSSLVYDTQIKRHLSNSRISVFTYLVMIQDFNHLYLQSTLFSTRELYIRISVWTPIIAKRF